MNIKKKEEYGKGKKCIPQKQFQILDQFKGCETQIMNYRLKPQTISTARKIMVIRNKNMDAVYQLSLSLGQPLSVQIPQMRNSLVISPAKIPNNKVTIKNEQTIQEPNFPVQSSKQGKKIQQSYNTFPLRTAPKLKNTNPFSSLVFAEDNKKKRKPMDRFYSQQLRARSAGPFKKKTQEYIHEVSPVRPKSQRRKVFSQKMIKRSVPDEKYISPWQLRNSQHETLQ